MRHLARAGVAATLLASTLVFLHRAGAGQLAAPPVASPGSLSAWATDLGPTAAGLALVRFAAELVNWYLLVLCVAQVLARVLRFRWSAAIVHALTVPAVPRVLRGTLGIGLVVATAPGHAGRTAAAAPIAFSPSVPATSAEAPGDGTATMRPRGDAGTSGTATMVPGPGRPGPVDVRGTARDTAPRPPPPSWRVEVGDSFWSIAAEVLEDVWGRPPSDREIVPFWQDLVEVNRDRLVTEGDPDLVHPGQVFEIPPVPEPR